MEFPTLPTSRSTPRCRVSFESGLPQTFVLDSKKGQSPQKARPYNLDYRPLIDRDLTNRAIAFMKRQAESEKPFFIYLPYTATHFPTLPHPEFEGKSGKGLWGDMLMQIDSYVGELLDTVDDLGVAENTIFIFTADNGPEALEAGSTSITVETGVHGSAGPWRGTLFTGFEGALRVPFAIRWPGRITPGTSSDEIVHAMDLYPTLARIAGGAVPDDRIIDGIDVSDFLLVEDPDRRPGLRRLRRRSLHERQRRFGRWGLSRRSTSTRPRHRGQDPWNTILRTSRCHAYFNLISDRLADHDDVLFPHTGVLQVPHRRQLEHTRVAKEESASVGP